MGVEEQEREQTLTTLGFAAAEDKATISTFSLKGAFRSLGTVIATNPIGVIVTAVSIATMVFSGFNQVMEESRQKARNLGEELKSTKSDIDSYKSKIEDLYKTINDSGSSISDVTEARKNLMTIQDELIEKYGAEENVIKDVTDAINGQADTLDRLTQTKWQEIKNEFNDTGFWEGIGNWLSGYGKNIDRMVDKMEHANVSLSGLPAEHVYIGINGIKDYSADYESATNDFIKALKDAGYDYDIYSASIKLHGGLRTVYSDILNIQKIAEEYDAPENFLKSLTKEANRAKETLDDYGEMWDTHILRDVILENKELTQSWKDVNGAYSDYRKAFESGDKKAQNNAIDGFAQSLNNVLDNSDVADSVKEYFRNMYPVLTNEVEKWEFRYKILPDLDIHALKGKTQADILEMLQTDGSQFGEDTFNSLLRMASDYGIVIGDNSERIKQLLDLLVEWEVLQGNIVDMNIPDTPISFDISTYKDQIDNFQSQVKTLGDALSSIRSGNFEDSDLTDLLQEFPELTDKSDDLESALVELINNSLKVLYDTLGDEVPDSLKTSLQELTDIASGTAMHLGDAFSSIHSSWDILQDFKDTLSSGFDDNITDSLLQSVRGLSGELETLVAGYYSGVVTAEELYAALTTHYENNLHNYSEALIKKNELNEGFYNAVGLASEEVTNQFMDDYDVDLENCKTYNEAKLEIEKQTLEQISGAWSQYYDAQAKTLKISMSEIEARAAHGGSDAAAFLEQYELIEKYEAAIEALNDITYNGIKSNFESISSKWNTNSSSSSKSSSAETSAKETKEFSEELNWVENLLKQPRCEFVLYVGNKKLVKRKEFEQYISRSLEI